MRNWLMRPIDADEERAIAAFMDRVSAAASVDQPRLVDPGLLLVKAQLLAKWDRERAVHAPLDFMNRLQLAASLVAAALLLAWSIPALARLLALVIV